MAKRGRHPGRKSQTKSHNKNPKLSPFQREQKRNKLANQAPTAVSESNTGRQYSRSQREVFKYFERREEVEAAHALSHPQAPMPAEKMGKARLRKFLKNQDAAAGTPAEAAAAPTPRKRPVRGMEANASNLNSQLLEGASSFESRIVQDPTMATILRKKAKKHEKKQTARKEKLQNMLIEGEARVRQEMLKEKKGGKKGSKRQRDETAANESGPTVADASAGGTTAKKSIFFYGESSAGDGLHTTMRFSNDTGARKPQEFYELVDVVKFGDRVEAPPVFSVLPDNKAKISLLGAKLLEESDEGSARKKKRTERRDDGTRHSLLGGSSDLAERKRLVKLGLQSATAPAAPLDAVPARGPPEGLCQVGAQTTHDEFALLRDKVMETYRRNKVAHRLNTNHVFPVLS